MGEYSTLANMRKFEWVEPSSCSILNYEEANRILARWQAIATQAQQISKALPSEWKPAFYQLVLDSACRWQSRGHSGWWREEHHLCTNGPK